MYSVSTFFRLIQYKRECGHRIHVLFMMYDIYWYCQMKKKRMIMKILKKEWFIWKFFMHDISCKQILSFMHDISCKQIFIINRQICYIYLLPCLGMLYFMPPKSFKLYRFTFFWPSEYKSMPHAPVIWWCNLLYYGNLIIPHT
jgi:hypothetical protein